MPFFIAMTVGFAVFATVLDQHPDAPIAKGGKLRQSVVATVDRSLND